MAAHEVVFVEAGPEAQQQGFVGGRGLQLHDWDVRSMLLEEIDAAKMGEEDSGKAGSSKQHFGSGSVTSSMSCLVVGIRGVSSGLQHSDAARRP